MEEMLTGCRVFLAIPYAGMMSKSTRAGCASHVLIPAGEKTALRDRE